jgi:tetratricopeptide (TPR) repeat protein
MGLRSALSYAELRLGNPSRAIKELDEVWENAVKEEDYGTQRETLRDRGIVFLEMGSIEQAEKTAKKLKKLAEEAPNKKLIYNYYYLQGRIELDKGNFSKAIEYIEKGLQLLSATSDLNLTYTDSLGWAYYKAGDLGNAQKIYRRASSSTTGRLIYGDIYAKSFYMLGKIYEQQGDTAQAIEHYEKFLDLWKDADPGIDEIKDARKRLAGLRGN